MGKTRGDCAGGPQPCPWVRCRHHLYLEVAERTGSLYINFPKLRPDQLAESCSLDVADRGGVPLQKVRRSIGVAVDRARQIEVEACRSLNVELLKAGRLAARFRPRFRANAGCDGAAAQQGAAE